MNSIIGDKENIPREVKYMKKFVQSEMCEKL